MMLVSSTKHNRGVNKGEHKEKKNQKEKIKEPNKEREGLARNNRENF
jgi:hypothetical protein